jgi:hypothetical protein
MTGAPGPGQIPVLIADDRRVVRDGLSMLAAFLDAWRSRARPATEPRRYGWPRLSHIIPVTKKDALSCAELSL